MDCNIKDVANKAGVSIATVSRVINKSAPVSEELKKRVLTAINTLGFRPNNLARSMRKKETSLIGMILPDLTNPFFPLVTRGAEETFRKKEVSLIIINSDQNLKTELEAAKMLIDKKVDGVLFTGTGEDSETIDLLIEKTNVVFLDRINKGKVASVVSDNYGGMRQMINYLYDLGHRKMWYLGGPKNLSSSIERKKAVIDFMNEKNDVYILLFRGKFNYEWGFKKTSQMLNNAIHPEAIVCANDMIALGAMHACEENGFSVPEDLSITGYDDIFFAKYFNPPLTTIRQPMYELGAEGAKLLSEYIKGKRKRPISKIMENSLITRSSVKARI
jgi:LacI family transcriptional regulator